MKKTLVITFFAIVSLTGIAQADTATAQQILAQNSTNPICASGYNGANPFEKSEMFKKDQFENKCPAGMSYVECLRESWKQQK